MSNKSSKPIKITLFHADWCHHCVSFMPIWNEMRTNLKAKQNIQFENHEESTINNLSKDIRTIDNTDVRSLGYPSIKIDVAGKQYIYSGRRTPENIYQSILDSLNE